MKRHGLHWFRTGLRYLKILWRFCKTEKSLNPFLVNVFILNPLETPKDPLETPKNPLEKLNKNPLETPKNALEKPKNTIGNTKKQSLSSWVQKWVNIAKLTSQLPQLQIPSALFLPQFLVKKYITSNSCQICFAIFWNTFKAFLKPFWRFWRNHQKVWKRDGSKCLHDM